jgi:hypothetical protein
MADESIKPTIGELIELAQDRPVRISVPLPSSIALEDTETIREYVESMIANRLAEDFDDSSCQNQLNK